MRSMTKSADHRRGLSATSTQHKVDVRSVIMFRREGEDDDDRLLRRLLAAGGKSDHAG